MKLKVGDKLQFNEYPESTYEILNIDLGNSCEVRMFVNNIFRSDFIYPTSLIETLIFNKTLTLIKPIITAQDFKLDCTCEMLTIMQSGCKCGAIQPYKGITL